MSKVKILVLVDWYLPGVKAGGPIRSVSAIVGALKGEFDFYLLTRNNDFGESTPYKDIEANTWIKKDGYHIQYLSPDKLTYRFIKKEVRSGQYDRFYLNSLFSVPFTLWPLYAIPKKERKKVILAPRGMLGQGALQIKSAKKKWFLKIARSMGLYRKVTWHASTALEEGEIKLVFPKAQVQPLENLPAITPVEYKEKLKEAGKLRLVFLSRISPKKNLEFLLDRLITLGQAGIQLDIYGPEEDLSYSRQCREKGALCLGEVRFKGSVPYERITETLQHYHAFVLPTLNENFGHVILEALNASLPVYLSDQTPWLDLDEHQAGRVLPLSQIESWEQALKDLLEMDGKIYSDYSHSAWEYARKKFDTSELTERYRSLFRD